MTPDKPSSTAQLIARSTVFVARDPHLGKLVPLRATEASIWFLKATSPHANQLLSLIERKWFRASVKLIEALTIPGILLHYIVRKRYLEDLVRDGLADGAAQVVVLGAGFDTLALRVGQEFPAITFIEVDHPATQRIKERVLQEHQFTNSNLHLLPVDLSQQSLTDSLLMCPHYKRDESTIFVAEGLLMYLRPNQVSELFQFVARHSGRGSRFAFTFLEQQHKGRVNFQRGSALIDQWLNWRGEGFQWGIKRQKLESYLDTCGLSLQEITGAGVLRQRYLKAHAIAGARLARGEYIGVARTKLD